MVECLLEEMLDRSDEQVGYDRYQQGRELLQRHRRAVVQRVSIVEEQRVPPSALWLPVEGSGLLLPVLLFERQAEPEQVLVIAFMSKWTTAMSDTSFSNGHNKWSRTDGVYGTHVPQRAFSVCRLSGWLCWYSKSYSSNQ
jgi:hypothetical protein